jgi:hypothetical protein
MGLNLSVPFVIFICINLVILWNTEFGKCFGSVGFQDAW